FFFFQAEDGIRDFHVTGVQTCALPIWARVPARPRWCHGGEVMTVKVLAVYESHFGNTGRVARAVAEGLVPCAEVGLLDIEQAPPIGELRAHLLVIGAPTHVLGLSRSDSRREALEQAGLPEASPRGIREWLAGATAATPPVAVFDTRTLESRLPGSAARAVVRRLRRRGVPVVA